MPMKKIAALFSATALVPTLLAGCLQVEQPLVVDDTGDVYHVAILAD